MLGELSFQFEPELAGVRWGEFQYALERLPYASLPRVALQLLAATGCRITELDRMSPEHLLDGVLYWRLGKNQVGRRSERLPPGLVAELVAYRLRHRTTGERLLGPRAETFVRYFDRDWRPFLGGRWAERGRVYINGVGWREGWVLHLKYFRKTFQSLLFQYFFEKYGSADVAVGWVSKRMRHSNRGITLHHYLQNTAEIGVAEWLSWLTQGRVARQRRIWDY